MIKEIIILLLDEGNIEEQTYDTNVWEACWDNDTSRIYFYNRVTGLSQWEEPPIMWLGQIAVRDIIPIYSYINICDYALFRITGEDRMRTHLSKYKFNHSHTC